MKRAFVLLIQIICIIPLYSGDYSPDNYKPLSFKPPPPELKRIIDKYFTPRNFLDIDVLEDEGKLIFIQNESFWKSFSSTGQKDYYNGGRSSPCQKKDWIVYFILNLNVARDIISSDSDRHIMSLAIKQKRFFSNNSNVRDFVLKKLKAKHMARYKLYNKYFEFYVYATGCCHERHYSFIHYNFCDYTHHVKEYLEVKKQEKKDENLIILD